MPLDQISICQLLTTRVGAQDMPATQKRPRNASTSLYQVTGSSRPFTKTLCPSTTADQCRLLFGDFVCFLILKQFSFILKFYRQKKYIIEVFSAAGVIININNSIKHRMFSAFTGNTAIIIYIDAKLL